MHRRSHAIISASSAGGTRGVVATGVPASVGHATRTIIASMSACPAAAHRAACSSQSPLWNIARHGGRAIFRRAIVFKRGCAAPRFMACCALCRLPVGGGGVGGIYCFECELELRAGEETAMPCSVSAPCCSSALKPLKRVRRTAVVRATARCSPASRKCAPETNGGLTLPMQKILSSPECPICFCEYDVELDAPRVPLRTACCTGHFCGTCGPRAAAPGTRCPLCAKPNVSWVRDVDAACSLRVFWRCERCGVRVRGAELAEHARGSTCVPRAK